MDTDTDMPSMFKLSSVAQEKTEERRTWINSRDNVNEPIDDLKEISEVKEDYKDTKSLLYMKGNETSSVSLEDKKEAFYGSTQNHYGKYNMIAFFNF